MDASVWDTRYAASDLVWSAGPNEFVASYCADLAPGRSLDLAAGEGRNALWLAEQGWDSTAVDFSPVAIEKLKKIAAHRSISVTAVVADLVEYQPTRGSYDLIALIYFHVEPPLVGAGRCPLRRRAGSGRPTPHRWP
ncbi:MAG: class I SAM-dependent methyltransferase [Acidimicrobiales bacterium]